MKRCPVCSRTYFDETLNFCLEDGAQLAADGGLHEGSSTAILPGVPPSEAPTRRQVNTDALYTPQTSRSKAAFSTKTLIWILAVAAIAVGGFTAYRYFYRGGDQQISSIAVIPFANETGNADLEYLSDGMTESLISSLSQLPNVRVKARSSVFRYKGKAVEPGAAGRELAVEAILTGRLVQQGNAVALYVELVHTATEDTLWKHDYTRPLTNVVLMQNELAKDVASRLRARLSGLEQERLVRSQTVDAEAYNLYLMGRYHQNRLTDDGFRKGVQYFREAIAKDPQYALAHAGLADAYNRLGGFNAASPKESFPLAKEAALRALEIDSSLADAHAALAIAKFSYDWDWMAAESEFRRAIELDPGNANCHQAYALFLAAMRRFEQAHVEARLSRELDPLSLENQMIVGDVYYFQRHYDDALVEYGKALEMDPNSGLANWAAGMCYMHKGMYPDAIASFKRSIPLSGDSPDELVELARAYALSGNRSEAIKIVDDLRLSMQQRYISPTAIGSLYLALGDKDAAFRWFDRAVQERDFLLVLLKVEPMFDSARSDPRFQRLVEQVGLPE